MHPSDNIGFLLHHLAFSLMRQSDQLLQDVLGIGFSQFKILRVVEATPYLRQKQIAAMHLQQKQIAAILGQTEESISRQVKLMHEQGLLITTVRAENKREHITTLTSKGVQYSNQAMTVLNGHYQPMFDQLTQTEQSALQTTLQKMHNIACNDTNSNCH